MVLTGELVTPVASSQRSFTSVLATQSGATYFNCNLHALPDTGAPSPINDWPKNPCLLAGEFKALINPKVAPNEFG